MKVRLIAGLPRRAFHRADIARALEVLVAEAAPSAVQDFDLLTLIEEFIGAAGFLIRDDRTERHFEHHVFTVFAVPALALTRISALRHEKIAVAIRCEAGDVAHRRKVYVAAFPAVASGGTHELLPLFMQP